MRCGEGGWWEGWRSGEVETREEDDRCWMVERKGESFDQASTSEFNRASRSTILRILRRTIVSLYQRNAKRKDEPEPKLLRRPD